MPVLKKPKQLLPLFHPTTKIISMPN